MISCSIATSKSSAAMASSPWALPMVATTWSRNFRSEALRTGAELFDERAVTSAGEHQRVYRTAPAFCLKVGKTYHLEFAFVDRRLTLAINGVEVFTPVDRPAVDGRGGVERPVKLGALGVETRWSKVRLYRDIHYTGAGHAVGAPVRLGARQYFVLGDNSPNSEDNRIWSDADHRPVPVPEDAFLGKPFLVHLPSQVLHGSWFGHEYEYQGVDWRRVALVALTRAKWPEGPCVVQDPLGTMPRLLYYPFGPGPCEDAE